MNGRARGGGAGFIGACKASTCGFFLSFSSKCLFNFWFVSARFRGFRMDVKGLYRKVEACLSEFEGCSANQNGVEGGVAEGGMPKVAFWCFLHVLFSPGPRAIFAQGSFCPGQSGNSDRVKGTNTFL